jgi:hypothetical protein
VAEVRSTGRRIKPRPPRPSASGNRDPDASLDVQGSPAQLSALLHQGDAATRESVTTRLHPRVGNTAVQRLVDLQRQPPPRTPIAAGGSETRTPIAAGPERRIPTATGGSQQRVPIATGPQPSKAPPLELRSKSAAKWLADTMGEPFVESMPLTTEADRALVQTSNDYFGSNPLEPWERSSGEHLKKRNALTEVFQRKAHQLTLHIVSKSEEQAFSELLRYSGDPGTDNEAAADLRDAATHLSKVQAEILQVSGLSDAAREVRRGVPSVFGMHRDPMRASGFEGLDDDLQKLETAKFDEAVVSVKTELEDRRKAVLAVAQRYRALKDVYGQRFPILLPKNQDYSKIAQAKPGDIASYAAGPARGVIKSTYEFRDKFAAEKIWSLPVIIDQTKKLMGIEEGTGANDAIEGKRDDIAWDALVHKLGMAALQLGLSLVAAALTGGTSLIVQGAGALAATGVAVVSGGQVMESWREYKFGKAAAGEISLDPAVRLAAEEPGWGWLAFDIAMMVVDIAEIAAAVRAMRSTMKAAEAAGGLKLLGPPGSTAGGLAASADDLLQTRMTLAQVEEVVRAQAKVLKQEGRLAPGLTEDIFVERIMSGLRRKVAKSGEELGEMQATVLAGVINRTHPSYAALVRGDPDELTRLLIHHGEWKTLVTGLERGGQEAIANNLATLRQSIVDQVSAELRGLSREGDAVDVKPLSPASHEAASDIDLQISGPHAGRALIVAEQLMAARLGDNWSQMLRLNFYTEGSRLTRYQDVMGALRPNEKAALTGRITREAERLNFAKMLHHAGSDQAAIARVEAHARSMGVDLEPLRPLATMDDAARIGRRNALLAEIDDLQLEFTTATGPRRVELAEQISLRQMEANFFTHEANIAPTSLKASGVSGLARQEGYQAVLTQLEMIEHILHEAGGNIALAAREYELFKYIARFANAAERGGHHSRALTYLKNHGEAVSGTHREIMEETAHVYLGRGRRAGVTDSPQVAGTQAEVTNEFIYKHWDMFRAEAETTLRALNRNAPPPVLPPRPPRTPRSGRTTAPIRVTDSVDAAGDTRSYADRILDHSTPDRYLVMDPANPRLKAEAHLEGDGELSLSFRTILEGGERSELLRGEEQFERVMMHFGGKVKSIRGSWSYGTNLAKFNEATGAGRSAEKAAFETWTGQQSAAQGYTKVAVVSLEGKPGAYTKVVVRFLP